MDIEEDGMSVEPTTSETTVEKKKRGGSKGPPWEREICKLLSRWWTKDYLEPDEDIFWRTAGSGARATTRKKKGKKTDYQHGDVTFTNPIGEPFIRAFTVELKRGYSKSSIFDLIDKTNQKSLYGEWINKITEQCYQQNNFSWLLITKRDRRVPMVYLPIDKFLFLIYRTEFIPTFGSPVVKLNFLLDNKPQEIIGITLEEWMAVVHPRNVRMVANRLRRPWLIYDRLNDRPEDIGELDANGHYIDKAQKLPEAPQEERQVIK